MFFFRALAAASAFFLVVSPTFASPTPRSEVVEIESNLVASTDVNILDIFTELQVVVEEILPEIESLIESNTLTPDLFTPLVNGLITAINQATSDLGSLDKSSIVIGGTNEELATLVAAIVKNISSTMDGLTNTNVDVSALDLGPVLLDIVGVVVGLLVAVVGLVGGLLVLLLPLLLPVVGLLLSIVVGLLGALLGPIL